MRALVYGVGATGSRVARQLISTNRLTDLVLVDQDSDVSDQAAASLGKPARVASVAALRSEARLHNFFSLVEEADVVVLTTADDHADFAEAALRSRTHVVSLADDPDTVERLIGLSGIAHENSVSLIVGAGFAPGMTDILALHAAKSFDTVDEIHVAKFGTGGPECARQHHRSLREESLAWRDGEWMTTLGGSGRELFYFPDPVGGQDCYQAALPDPILLHTSFPEAGRITARVSATRRDMSTRFLPMLRRPHPEGLIGAVRVELRGWENKQRKTSILGALDRPAVAAGTVAAVSALWAHDNRFARTGAGGLGELVGDTASFLADLAERGVKAAVFEGSSGH